MDLKVSLHQNWTLIDLDGRLDSFNYEDIKSKLNTLIKMGKKQLILDLSGVHFIAVPNLRFIIQTSKSLQNQKGQLRIVGASKKILSHFDQVSGLNHIQAFSSFKEMDLQVLT